MARVLVRLVLSLAMFAAAAVPAAASGPRLAVDGARLVDGHGRQVLLRGGALISKSKPGLPVVTERDWENLGALGWNSIRLGTAWEWIEPEPGQYDAAYLDKLAALAREAMDRGLYVVIDMHQDVWGRPVGGGAPAWTERPECASRHVDLAGASGAWSANYLSPWTFCQFDAFWSDTALQDHLIGAWREVARRVGSHSRLAGYDLINEPFQGTNPPAAFEARVLLPFYERAIAAIRGVDRDAIAFFEPANSKNIHLPTATPAGRAPAGAVYAPHVYGLWDANDAFSERSALVETNMRLSRAEADLMATPLWYGEFGMRRGAPRAEETLRQIYDIADAQLAGTAIWEYARNSYGVLRSDGSLDPERAATTSRAYPAATAGSVERFSFDPVAGRFELDWTATSGTTKVVLPRVHFGERPTVDASPGVSFERRPGTQRLIVRAEPGRHALVVTRAGATRRRGRR